MHSTEVKNYPETPLDAAEFQDYLTEFLVTGDGLDTAVAVALRAGILQSADLARETDTYYFTALGHWELSHVVTTNHLLSVIAITNTLVSVSNATFVPEQERKRKLVRQATHGAMEVAMNSDSSFGHVQEQIKQGWSLLRDYTRMTSARKSFLSTSHASTYCIHIYCRNSILQNFPTL